MRLYGPSRSVLANLALALSAGALLSACGGGGGGADTVPTPSLVTPTPTSPPPTPPSPSPPPSSPPPATGTAPEPEGRISEFHYENIGQDVGEFVEVQVPTGTDVSDYVVELYNGATGLVYDTLPLSAVAISSNSGFVRSALASEGEFYPIASSSTDEFDYYVIQLGPDGLQNGAPDGLALIAGTEVLEFISYEGDFEAMDGAAEGMASVDIEVSQSPSTPIGSSLQALEGETWTETSGSNTQGAANVTPNPPVGSEPPANDPDEPSDPDAPSDPDGSNDPNDPGDTSDPADPNAPTTPPPPATASLQGQTWTQGLFEPADSFIHQCAASRSGLNARGEPFADEPGSFAEELLWLRSWTDETYLWNDEVEDVNPFTYNDVEDYFDDLKTDEIEPNGLARDRFHFSRDTADVLARRLSAPSPEYGVTFIRGPQDFPRDWRVLFTEPNTPASEVVDGQPNLVRGTRLLEVDGADFVNGFTQAEVDILNAGLFPDTEGETHTFLVQDPGASTPREITMTSANVTETAVNRTLVLDTPTGDVGYILFNTFGTFSAEQEIAAAMTQLSNAGVTDLVLDLRYNGGGLLWIASQTSYMIAGPTRTNGRLFEALVINDNPANIIRTYDTDTPFFDTGVGFSLPDTTDLDSLDLDRVFILSTGDTCSASEAVINGLRGINVEVILIGGRTCGKPYGFYGRDNCGITYYTIQFAGTNDIGFGDYAAGFVPNDTTDSLGVRIPGCTVEDDLNYELGDPNEALLSAALTYRETLSCPTEGASSVSSEVAVSALDRNRIEPGYDWVSPTGTASAERPPDEGMIFGLPE